MYRINSLVAKYSCLPPYRGNAYSRCSGISNHWSRVNLTCVNFKIPPDEIFSSSMTPRQKILVSQDSSILMDHLPFGKFMATSPNTPVTRSKADAVVRTCGVPPKIAGTVSVVVNEYMVKYACIDENQV